MIRLVSVVLECQRSADGWSLGCVKTWVIVGIAIDLCVATVAYLGVSLPVQLSMSAVASRFADDPRTFGPYVASGAVPALIAHVATPRLQKRIPWGRAKRRSLSAPGATFRVTLWSQVHENIHRACAIKSSEWINDEAIPALMRYDIASFKGEILSFIRLMSRDRQNGYTTLGVIEKEFRSSRPVEEQLRTVCTTVVANGGIKKLRRIVRKARRQYAAATRPALSPGMGSEPFSSA